MHFRSILPRIAVGLAALVSSSFGHAAGLFATNQYGALSGPQAVAMADVNGDGKLDAVVLGADGSVSVFLGNGDGTFNSPLHYYAAGMNPEALAVADVNGDNKPDIIVVNINSGNVSVLLGNGDGTFQDRTLTQAASGTGTPAPTYSVGNDPFYIAVADVNGDGKPDLVVANYKDATVSVLLGNGDGSFKPQLVIPVGNGPDCINVADFNGDGKQDILVSNSLDGTLGVLLGKGDGSFQAMQTTSVNAAVRNATLQMAVVGDLNHDGKLDVVSTISSSSGTTLALFTGNGDGTFGTGQPITAPLQTRYLALADVNGDGNLDIVAGSFANATFSVLFGHGNFSFDAPVDYPAPGINSAVALQPFAVGDVNGDGKPDIVAVNPSGSFIQVRLNNGSGGFHPPLSMTLGQIPAAVVSADLNGDGKPDLVVANSQNGTVEVLLGNGNGSFTLANTYTVGSHPQALKLADVNGDGKLDLLVGNFGDNTIGVMLGNGTGGFGPMVAYPAGPNLVDFAVVDMNHDGKLDLVAANQVVNTVSVLLGNGDGTFQAPVSYATTIGVNALAVGDLTHTGFPDVVAVGSRVAVLRNDGKGGLITPVYNSQNVSADVYTAIGAKVALADIQNNGQPAILIADYSNSQLVVLLGNNQGSFGTPMDFPTCANPNNLAVADLNADGNLDVAVTCSGSSTVGVLLGNGLGGFISTPYLVEIDPRAVTVADFNGDGQPDLAVVNGGSNTLNMLLEITGVVAADTAPVATGNSVSTADGKYPIDSQMVASDANGDALTYGVVTQPIGGSLSFISLNGTFEYQASQGFTGNDSFQFQVTDGIKLSNIATVNVKVSANSLGNSSGGGGGLLGAFYPPFLLVLLPIAWWRRRAKLRGN